MFARIQAWFAAIVRLIAEAFTSDVTAEQLVSL
jgi:hypothetical protein